MLTRKWQHYLVVIGLTSLVWCMLDVWLLTYYSSCADNTKQDKQVGAKRSLDDPKSENHQDHQEPKNIPEKTPSLIHKLIEKIPEALKPVPTQPGDGGKGVEIPENLKEKSKEMFKINQFNLMASDMMSLNRTLPDYRMSQCQSKEYPVNDLPATSVIIVFHNEAWSTLLRTVHSVINRSPRHLLHEIVMVDDASDQDHLKSKLDEYCSKLPVPVHVIRMPERVGLIRARLKGAEKASGKVLTFLDAHCECTIGWLEPLLFEIHKDRRAVPCPIIDVVSDDDFSYITGGDSTWGGFNWKLNFRWYQSSSRELERRGGDRSVPMRSPTMAGGLFSIDRAYFYEVGSYDDGMNIWGGENLEMSFRVWQCGGSILIVTCSRVGHVFRKFSPYSWPGGVSNIINHNSQRIASVWMDEYQEIFYKHNPGVKAVDPGDMTDRMNLRKNLKCKSFKWYLQNIYPESHIPIDFKSVGRVVNPETNLCIDGNGKKSGEQMSLITCHNRGGNQIFVYTSDLAFRTDEVCMDSSSVSEPVKLFHCHRQGGNQKFLYQNKQIIHDPSKYCVTIVGSNLMLEQCTSKASQVWDIEGYKE